MRTHDILTLRPGPKPSPDEITSSYNKRIDRWLRTADTIRGVTRVAALPTVAAVTITTTVLSGGWGGPLGYFVTNAGWSALKIAETAIDKHALTLVQERDKALGNTNKETLKAQKNAQRRSTWRMIASVPAAAIGPAVGLGIVGAHLYEIGTAVGSLIAKGAFDQIAEAALFSPVAGYLAETAAAQSTFALGKMNSYADNALRRVLRGERERTYTAERRGMKLQEFDAKINSIFVQHRFGYSRLAINAAKWVASRMTSEASHKKTTKPAQI